MIFIIFTLVFYNILINNRVGIKIILNSFETDAVYSSHLKT